MVLITSENSFWYDTQGPTDRGDSSDGDINVFSSDLDSAYKAGKARYDKQSNERFDRELGERQRRDGDDDAWMMYLPGMGVQTSAVGSETKQHDFVLHPAEAAKTINGKPILPGTYFDSHEPDLTSSSTIDAMFGTPSSIMQVNMAAENRVYDGDNLHENVSELFGQDITTTSNQPIAHDDKPYSINGPSYMSSSHSAMPEQMQFYASNAEEQALEAGMSKAGSTPLVSSKLLGAVVRADDWRTSQADGSYTALPAPFSTSAPMRNTSTPADSFYQLNMQTNPHLFAPRKITLSNKDLSHPNALNTGPLPPELRIAYTHQPNQPAGLPVFGVAMPHAETQKYSAITSKAEYNKISSLQDTDTTGLGAAGGDTQYANIGSMLHINPYGNSTMAQQ